MSAMTAIEVHRGAAPAGQMALWESFVLDRGRSALSDHPAWPDVLSAGLGHVPYWIVAAEGRRLRGLLPLCYVRSLLFGRYLVGLPYLNYGGAVADDEAIASLMIDRAVALADELGVRRLELRHELAVEHARLSTRSGHKVHMRRVLPSSADALWNSLGSSVRNQVRKGEKLGLTVHWGAEERLGEFFDVFSRNMRDLGTPVFGRRLFASILRAFPGRCEFCIVHLGGRPVASALLLHGRGVTEVPSASSLRAYNPTCANMLMYWNLLSRAVGRGQRSFDFGRSSPESPTYRFKKQWGAEPYPAAWQDYPESCDVGDTSRENPRYQRFIRLWRKLPLAMTRWLGPCIVRGIP